VPESLGLFSREGKLAFRVLPILSYADGHVEYTVVRNAGGRSEPAIRDICVLTSMAKITDLVVIHHVGRKPPQSNWYLTDHLQIVE
jgi:hypothetical protein